MVVLLVKSAVAVGHFCATAIKAQLGVPVSAVVVRGTYLFYDS